MASMSGSLPVEQFICSICQDVFKDPATIPCGHNFCIKCISEHWDSSVGIQCPLCKKDFHLRPEFDINREFREIIEHLRKGESPIKPGEIPCHACVKIKQKALKSCLHCGGTFCKTHLEPHNTVAQLKNHKLVDPAENLEDYMCQKHDRPLELFCRDDKTQLMNKRAEVRLMIQYKTEKSEEIRNQVKLSRQKTDKEKAYCVGLFTDLMHSIERCQSELLDLMEQKQKAAEDVMKELEQEITELKRRDTELETLSQSEDHLHLLQIYPSLCSPLKGRNWSEISIDTYISVDTVRRVLTKHQECLYHALINVTGIELRRIEKFAVNVTMDPQTAHPKLLLSEDAKQAVYGETQQEVPDSPMRFDTCPGVLGKEEFSSGKCYFEVQVKGKTEWDLGVAGESVKRKGTITLSPRNGIWTLRLRNGIEYKACDIPSVSLSLGVKPQRMGVFVDYEEGLVSFYDVESRSHIYSFTGQSFTEKLHPYLSPCFNNGDKNSAPLVILPISNQSLNPYRDASRQ
ncbi:E3 ubiquitin-protein ligase TRIM21-like isoform X2 [Triplophysa dalaica]|uniref:E3 ubiquitin-protein ligase TRIM21-like isoform X2 n=1 Tax=Triplophysa dalaica TaxID=1582913 RepID=UPI0024E00CDB|nr:E3 ubiquitin-protein ligase TRIM21-like isoform X2 [Triplophysa dalaica]